MPLKDLAFSIKLSALLGGNLKSEIPSVNRTLSDLQAKVQKLSGTKSDIANFQKTSQNLEKARAKLQAANERVRMLRQNLQKTSNPSKAMKQEFTKANEEVHKLQESVQKNMRSLGELRSSLKGAGVDVNHLSDAEKKLQDQTDRVAASQKRLTDAQARYADIKSKLLDWNNIKGDVLASAGTALAFKKPIQIDMEFEQAMGNVRAVMNPNKQDFNDLRNQALELGRTTQFSASQAAASQENFARAGFSKNEIINTMPALLAMSAAEGMDLAQGATILAGGLRGFNLEATQATRLADAFAYTSANSATGIAELGEGFKVAAGIADKLKLSPEKLLSYLGSLANRQVLGEQAGSTITNALTRLSDEKVNAKLRALGIRTKTKKGDMVDLPEILKQFDEKTRNKGEVYQVATLSEIFGKNYGKFMAGFMQESVSGNQYKLEYGLVHEKTGKAQEMANIRNDTLKGDITALSSAWEGLNIAIGSALDPINRFLTQTLTTGISKLTEFINQNKALCDIAIQIAYAFGGWLIVKNVLKYSKLLIQLPFAKLSTILAENAAQAALSGEKVSLIGSIFRTLTSPITTFGNLLKSTWALAMAHPFLAIGTAIAGIVSLSIYIYKHWDDIKALWHSALDWLSEKSQSALNWLSEKSNKIAEWWDNWVIPNVFQPLNDFIDNAINYIKTKWQDFCNWIKSLNPFSSWSAPSVETLKVQEHAIKTSAQGQHANSVADKYASQYKAHAKGGIFSSPHFGLVAEAGPEAIIPLSDKSRGLALLSQAADRLGVDFNFQNHTEDKIPHHDIQKFNVQSENNISRGFLSRLANITFANPVSNERSENNISRVLLSNFADGISLKQYMQGGVFSPQKLGAVAADSPEVISPLNEKSRSLASLSQAAYSTAYSLGTGATETKNSEIYNSQRPININISVTSEYENIADKIAQAVSNAISNLSEYEERVSFA